MPRASVILSVPEDLLEVADLLEEHGAEGDLGGCTESEEIRDFLSTRTGTMVTVDFESDDPTEPVHALADALEKVQSPFWAYHDGFTERSRGIRVPGRAFVNLTGLKADRTEIKLNWEDGPPALDDRTLKAAGMAPELASEVYDRFTGREPGTAPRTPWGA